MRAKTVYNEIDPFAVNWLRELMKAGQIEKGEVDERSIKDLRGSDLADVRRAHFFAGIGGWDLALRLSGWPEDREVWTGSCPCQPFSCAGKRLGTKDKRHLWPDFCRLIRECRPQCVFGEQVAGKSATDWLDNVQTDLENIGYAFGAASLNAAGFGSVIIRQRNYWVAVATDKSRSQKDCSTKKYAEASKMQRIEPISWQALSQLASKLDSPLVVRTSDGVPNRVGCLRGYGNAIVPALAAEFIKAYLETEQN